MALIECVPNISEGRRMDVVDAISQAVAFTPGIHYLDVSSDVSHNRSVLTFAGEAIHLQDAVLALFAAAITRIDLRAHDGVHPRIGAVDVVPFAPLEDATLADCVALARRTGAAVSSQFGIPTYLYEEAAMYPGRRRLEHLRRGQFEGLTTRLMEKGWQPDFGPATPHPTAGVTAVGARQILIAYNVNLATTRLDIARQIAATVRSSGGGRPGLKAMGVRLEHRGIVQVSMNLTDFRQTSIADAYRVVRQHAEGLGVDVLDSEIVGLVPEEAMTGIDAGEVKLVQAGLDRTIEARLRSTGYTLRASDA